MLLCWHSSLLWFDVVPHFRLQLPSLIRFPCSYLPPTQFQPGSSLTDITVTPVSAAGQGDPFTEPGPFVSKGGGKRETAKKGKGKGEAKGKAAKVKPKPAAKKGTKGKKSKGKKK